MFTVGHSTRTLADFIALLQGHGVAAIVDVRSMPRSRRHPQFSIESLPSALGTAGIAYAHAPALGGLRRPQRDSVNRGWRNLSFRAYADYMQTSAFATALDDLLDRAGATALAVLCAEGVWWRCHRSLIADAAVARGVEVRHIFDAVRTERHALRPWARVQQGRVWYPGQGELFANGADRLA